MLRDAWGLGPRRRASCLPMPSEKRLSLQTHRAPEITPSFKNPTPGDLEPNSFSQPHLAPKLSDLGGAHHIGLISLMSGLGLSLFPSERYCFLLCGGALFFRSAGQTAVAVAAGRVVRHGATRCGGAMNPGCRVMLHHVLMSSAAAEEPTASRTGTKGPAPSSRTRSLKRSCTRQPRRANPAAGARGSDGPAPRRFPAFPADSTGQAQRSTDLKMRDPGKLMTAGLWQATARLTSGTAEIKLHMPSKTHADFSLSLSTGLGRRAKAKPPPCAGCVP